MYRNPITSMSVEIMSLKKINNISKNENGEREFRDGGREVGRGGKGLKRIKMHYLHVSTP